MESLAHTLFVADVPPHLDEEEFVSSFQNLHGFVGARLKRDRNANRVGFIDFKDRDATAAALERIQGFKFDDDDTGISVHFAHDNHTRAKRNANRTTNNFDDGNTGGFNNAHYSQPRDSYRHSDGYRSISATDSRYLGHLPMVPMAGGLSTLGGLPEPMPSSMPFCSPVNMPFPAYGYGTSMGMAFPPLPPEAASTLYIEGLPLDATEREVSHIFRPMTGFLLVRILQKESKQYPNRTYSLCFAEFDNKYQATVAMHLLQGYKMDKNDLKGLHISYAKTVRKEKRRVLSDHNGTALVDGQSKAE